MCYISPLISGDIFFLNKKILCSCLQFVILRLGLNARIHWRMSVSTLSDILSEWWISDIWAFAPILCQKLPVLFWNVSYISLYSLLLQNPICSCYRQRDVFAARPLLIAVLFSGSCCNSLRGAIRFVDDCWCDHPWKCIRHPWRCCNLFS